MYAFCCDLEQQHHRKGVSMRQRTPESDRCLSVPTRGTRRLVLISVAVRGKCMMLPAQIGRRAGHDASNQSFFLTTEKE